MKLFKWIKERVFRKKEQVLTTENYVPSEYAVSFALIMDFVAEPVDGKLKIYMNNVALSSTCDKSSLFIKMSSDEVTKELMRRACESGVAYVEMFGTPLEKRVIPATKGVGKAVQPIDKNLLN